MIQIVDASEKYGDGQKTIVAAESIAAGEKIWWCSCSNDDYIMSRDDILHLIEIQPHLRSFLCWYSYMTEDDVYLIPHTFATQLNNDECVLFNHSCEPNCGFDSGDGNTIVAIRSISIGEELTYDYNFLETEPSLIRGTVCKCDTPSCVGTLMFDRYRDEDFQKRFYLYMSSYLQTRVRELKTKWYSTKCFTRSATDEKRKSLHVLEWIQAGEIVARFSGPVHIDNHFIRNVNKFEATCMIDEHKQVIALYDLPPESEITLNYHGKL
ncbi:unnamed protein product [Rotaria sp. Silwood2]|nr:unnamed protein product [Rotaria sp. Silwood2]CAF2600668.1 unnamed protein product [Rotaria sp. Silwood2]CAF2818444.1 unnamed protein product [Rotaria sp. Silwood2]CAF2971731.1 unnamed protein product [Rotaria sp. Silwood2]